MLHNYRVLFLADTFCKASDRQQLLQEQFTHKSLLFLKFSFYKLSKANKSYKAVNVKKIHDSQSGSKDVTLIVISGKIVVAKSATKYIMLLEDILSSKQVYLNRCSMCRLDSNTSIHVKWNGRGFIFDNSFCMLSHVGWVFRDSKMFFLVL